MDVTSFLSAENVVADYRAESKGQLLDELCIRAAKATGLDVETVSGEILKREQLGCTGVGGGIAIPHARFPNLKKPFGILVRLRKPLNYDAIDGEPVHNSGDLLLLLEQREPGDRVRLTILRHGKEQDVRIPLQPPEEE